MKKIKHLLTLLITTLLLWGVGKLYIAYNLSHYAAYYVQQLPRKEGINPELVIILTHLDYIETPRTKHLSYDFDGNGAIHYNLDGDSAIKFGRYITLLWGSDFRLWNQDENKNYVFDESTGAFSYYYTSNVNDTSYDQQYKKEAEAILDKMLPPILEAQPKPKINLQGLFNEKYYDRFN